MIKEQGVNLDHSTINRWVLKYAPELEQALKMTYRHEIDNARPVFPVSGRPYIRTRKDKEFFNNLSK